VSLKQVMNNCTSIATLTPVRNSNRYSPKGLRVA
jgi:hypothetical protein